MNPLLNLLHPYPFEKLAQLLAPVTPSREHGPINLSIGEPKHPVAPWIKEIMARNLDSISQYPTTRGELELRVAAAGWLERRFELDGGSVDPQRQLLPVNGTREALFSIVQAISRPQASKRGIVLMPNPFYQIYEGAAHMAGAEAYYVPATEESGFLPDYTTVPEHILARTRLVFLCSPANPTGAVYSLDALDRLLDLSERHKFILAADECYSEIWYQHPPPGLLQAASLRGLKDFKRCLCFHSLSKRSNMPGARSGFVAGDGDVLDSYFRLRTYTGCATPPFIQKAAMAAWGDETHVEENRTLYRQKLAMAMEILSPVLPVVAPDAGFYLWLRVPGGGEAFARHLYHRYHVTVLPGAYLGRGIGAANPGEPYVRVAMVAPLEEHREAMQRMAAAALDF